jgi:hypothetical protein
MSGCQSWYYTKDASGNIWNSTAYP